MSSINIIEKLFSNEMMIKLLIFCGIEGIFSFMRHLFIDIEDNKLNDES